MNRKETIIDILKAMETSVVIRIWNDYCNDECMEDYIWENNEYGLSDMFSSVDEALRAAFYGDYRYPDEYFIINAYGNLVSFDAYDAEKHIDLSLLAEYIMDNGCREIEEVWYPDLEGEFIEYACGKFDDREFTEEDIPAGADLIREDWDDIIEEMCG